MDLLTNADMPSKSVWLLHSQEPCDVGGKNMLREDAWKYQSHICEAVCKNYAAAEQFHQQPITTRDGDDRPEAEEYASLMREDRRDVLADMCSVIELG